MASPPKSGSMLWPQTPAAQQPWAPRGSGGGGGGGGLINTLAAAYLSGPGLHHTRRHSMAHLAAAVDDGENVGVADEWQREQQRQQLAAWGKGEAERCDSGDPDLELCELPGIIDTPPAERGAAVEAWSRGRWLLGLLVLQSMSSVVLDSYQELLRDHLVVTLFLTMLVGAGGNAGNQSAIKVIRGLATGSMAATGAGVRRAMTQQLAVGLLLGTGLAAGGWVRVYLTNGDALNATAISISLFLIVLVSVIAGTGLPFALARAGVDPANAGTSIQVVMDISGVLITCITCRFVLDTFATGLQAAS